MKNSKTFRLFVSSTFSDFAKERAVLQKKVFPEIKKYCAGKGYTFQPIDLRWGVSNEAQLDQKTIELCLNEVRVCKTHPHPNFLIMAGDRYGWIPLPYMIERSEFEIILESMNEDEKEEILSWYQLDLNQIPASYILEKRTGKYEQWKEWNKVENSLREILQTKVTQAFQAGKITEALKCKYFMSATEAEVEEGIFDYLEPTEFQQKLFEKKKDLPSIDKNNIFGFFRNIKKETLIGNVFIGNDYEQAQVFKGNAKKVLVAENILEIATTQKSEDTLDESYLEKLEENLFGFLKIKVDEHIENEKKYSEQEMKQQAQEYFLKEKTNNFIGREESLGHIAEYISDKNTRPLVIYGTSGIGKSAIMAKAILQARQRQKDKKVVSRFAGATTDASSTIEVLIGIFDDLGIDIRNGKNKEVGEILQTDNKPETFEDFSYRVHDQIMGLKDQVIIFIDAVDQLSNTDQFLWLPKTLPQNVKIILSALEDEKYEEDTKYFQTLKRKTENILPIPQFEKPEQLLLDLLKAEERTIQENQRQIFLKQHEAIKSPLYIHIVAQEMKNWRSFEEKNTLADTQQGAIEEFIENLTEIYHHDKKFVQKVFGYITASNGLSEYEIIDLLSIDKEFVKEMAPETYHKNETGEFPLVVWTRLYTQLKPFLGTKKEQRKDLLYFFHREFESIVANSDYQKQEHEAIIAATQELIKIYQNDGFESNRWGKLYATLIVEYDLKYEDEEKRDEYVGFVPNYIGNGEWIEKFIVLLYKYFWENYKYNRTKKALSYIKTINHIIAVLYEKTPKKWASNYVASLNNLAKALELINKYTESIAIRKKALAITEKLYDSNQQEGADYYLKSLRGYSNSLYKIGKTSESVSLMEKSIGVAEILYNKNPEQWAITYSLCLSDLATSLYKMDQAKKAIELEEKSTQVIKVLHRKDPEQWNAEYARALYSLSNLLEAVGRLRESGLVREECLSIIKRLYDKDHDQWAQRYVAILNGLADYFNFFPKKKFNHKFGWDLVTADIAIVSEEKSLAVLEKLHLKDPDRWADVYLVNLVSLASSLIEVERISDGIALGKEGLIVLEKLYRKDPDRWAEAYADLLRQLIDYLEKSWQSTEADELRKKYQDITTKPYRKSPSPQSGGRIGIFGNLRFYFNELKEEFNIARFERRIKKYERLKRSRVVKNYEIVIALKKRSLGIMETQYCKDPDRWAEGYTRNLLNLAYSLTNCNKATEAVVLGEKALAIMKKLYNQDPDRWAEEYITNLDNMAYSLNELKRTNEAIALEEESLMIFKKLYRSEPDRWAEGYAKALNGLANSLANIKKMSEAIIAQKRALEITEFLYQKNNKRWAECYTRDLENLSALCAEVDEYSNAIELLEKFINVKIPFTSDGKGWGHIKYQEKWERMIEKNPAIEFNRSKIKVECLKALCISYYLKGCQRIKTKGIRDPFYIYRIKLLFKVVVLMWRRRRGEAYAGSVEGEFKKLKI